MDSISVRVDKNVATNYERQFIEDLLKSILAKYCVGFRLSQVNELLIVQKLDNEADGNYNLSEKRLRISLRLLDTLRKSCSVYSRDCPINLASVMCDFNASDTIRTLRNTIYHELCHADNYHDMPNLYHLVIDDNSSIWKTLTALYWIEYVTHTQYKRIEDKRLFKQFIHDFYAYMPDVSTETGYCTVLKRLSYLIYRWEILEEDSFTNNLKPCREEAINRLIDDTYLFTKKLLSIYPFNEYKPLLPLEKIFVDTYNNMNK